MCTGPCDLGTEKPFVLYHLDQDGCAAALAAWKRFGDSAHYLPVNYGDDLPEIPDGAEVYILDFRFPREELIALNERVHKLVVIDHHESGVRELAGLEFALCGGDRAACVVSWEYFQPDTEIPELLLRVEDRDLWQFKYDDTRAVYAYLLMQGTSIAAWAETLALYEIDAVGVANDGQLLVAFMTQAAALLVAKAGPMQIGTKVVPVVNVALPWLISEVAHGLLESHPEAGFVAVWSQNANGSRTFNLRSRGKVNVAKLAEKFGGGGSKDTAGFVFPAPEDYEVIQPVKAREEKPAGDEALNEKAGAGQGLAQPPLLRAPHTVVRRYPFEIETPDRPPLGRSAAILVNDPAGPSGASHSYTVAWFTVRPGEPTEADRHDLKFQRSTEVGGQNGLYMEDVLIVLQHRLEGYQRGPLACSENVAALRGVQSALGAFHGRTVRCERERLSEFAEES